MHELDMQIKQALAEKVAPLEAHFTADVIFFYGPIYPSIQKQFRDFIHLLKTNANPKNRLVVFLNTPGGSAEIVEKMVEIIRFHYHEVYFVIPDEAMSAGTIFCMSGDNLRVMNSDS